MKLKFVIGAALCMIGMFLFSTQIHGETIPVSGIVQELGEVYDEVLQELELKERDVIIKTNDKSMRDDLHEEAKLASAEDVQKTLEEQVIPSDEYYIPNYSGMKSWMSWKSLTSRTSPQWRLQQYAWTDEDGFRRVNDRYMVAIGMYFNCEIGDLVDLTLANGTVINAVVGDRKSLAHTDSAGLFTTANQCMCEYIVSTDVLNSKVKSSGNCSKKDPTWDSPIVKVNIFDANVFYEEV